MPDKVGFAPLPKISVATKMLQFDENVMLEHRNWHKPNSFGKHTWWRCSAVMGPAAVVCAGKLLMQVSLCCWLGTAAILPAEDGDPRRPASSDVAPPASAIITSKQHCRQTVKCWVFTTKSVLFCCSVCCYICCGKRGLSHMSTK